MKRVCMLLVSSVLALPLLADGAAVYKAKCAMCHGADGAGQTKTGKTMKVKDLRSEAVQKLTDEEMTGIIADGKKKMPAYKAKLSAAEISELVKLIRTMKK